MLPCRTEWTQCAPIKSWCQGTLRTQAQTPEALPSLSWLQVTLMIFQSALPPPLSRSTARFPRETRAGTAREPQAHLGAPGAKTFQRNVHFSGCWALGLDVVEQAWGSLEQRSAIQGTFRKWCQRLSVGAGRLDARRRRRRALRLVFTASLNLGRVIPRTETSSKYTTSMMRNRNSQALSTCRLVPRLLLCCCAVVLKLCAVLGMRLLDSLPPPPATETKLSWPCDAGSLRSLFETQRWLLIIRSGCRCNRAPRKIRGRRSSLEVGFREWPWNYARPRSSKRDDT